MLCNLFILFYLKKKKKKKTNNGSSKMKKKIDLNGTFWYVIESMSTCKLYIGV
jgi:hypothetical protein